MSGSSAIYLPFLSLALTKIVSSFAKKYKAGKRITGRPDAVLFRKDEEKILHEKINEIRKAFTVKDDNKDYESLLIELSDTKNLPIIFLTMS